MAGALGGIDAECSGLVWEWLRILQEMPEKPALLLIKNVAGLLSTNAGANYTKLHYALLGLGYRSGAMLVDAALFVPQSRPRVFVIAMKRDMPIPVELCDSGPNWLYNKAAAILDRTLPHWIWWRADKPPRRNNSIADVIDLKPARNKYMKE